jgi:hypothetical protein
MAADGLRGVRGCTTGGGGVAANPAGARGVRQGNRRRLTYACQGWGLRGRWELLQIGNIERSRFSNHDSLKIIIGFFATCGADFGSFGLSF